MLSVSNSWAKRWSLLSRLETRWGPSPSPSPSRAMMKRWGTLHHRRLLGSLGRRGCPASHRSWMDWTASRPSFLSEGILCSRFNGFSEIIQVWLICCSELESYILYNFRFFSILLLLSIVRICFFLFIWDGFLSTLSAKSKKMEPETRIFHGCSSFLRVGCLPVGHPKEHTHSTTNILGGNFLGDRFDKPKNKILRVFSAIAFSMNRPNIKIHRDPPQTGVEPTFQKGSPIKMDILYPIGWSWRELWCPYNHISWVQILDNHFKWLKDYQTPDFHSICWFLVICEEEGMTETYPAGQRLEEVLY